MYVGIGLILATLMLYAHHLIAHGDTYAESHAILAQKQNLELIAMHTY